MSSKAYRRFAGGVERTLGLFDTKHEWADYIAYLRSLHKAVSARPEDITDIPFKSTIALHLAQCLKPTLPSGVHQKALEMYAYIFSIIGEEGLARDLPIYLPGLSSTLSFASLSIRPLYLSIVQEYILPLPARNQRPALKSLILSLLPGLEEQNSEDFDTALSLFDRIKHNFRNEGSEGLFWQTLFLASITDANSRPGVLVYLEKSLPRFGRKASPLASVQNGSAAGHNDDAFDQVLRPEPGLLIRCFATGLEDEQVLVQRGFLDLLVTHLPLNSPIFEKDVTLSDRQLLVTAGICVVLRRDMSLNRRLWSWFTGPEDQSEESIDDTDPSSTPDDLIAKGAITEASLSPSYAGQFGTPILIQAFKTMLGSPSNLPQENARPFRIARSLMDRWEIGGPVVSAIFIPLLERLMTYSNTCESSDDFEEAFRSASGFFDSVESYLIWGQIFRLITTGRWDLVDFIIARFNVLEAEMLELHIPLTALVLASLLRTSDQDKFEDPIRQRAPVLLKMLIGIIPQSAFAQPVANGHTQFLAQVDEKIPPSDDVSPEDMLVSIRAYYRNSSSSTPRRPPIQSRRLGERLYQELVMLYLACLEKSGDMDLVANITQALILLIARMTTTPPSESEKLSSHMLKQTKEDSAILQPVLVSMARVATSLSTLPSSNRSTFSELVSHFLSRLWQYLDNDFLQYHVETVQTIMDLHRSSEQSQIVQSAITVRLLDPIDQDQPSGSKLARFSVLWTHLRTSLQTDVVPDVLLQALMLVLDRNGEDSKIWIRSQQNVEPLINACLTQKSETSTTLRRLHMVMASMHNVQWQTLQGDSNRCFNGTLDFLFHLLSDSSMPIATLEETLALLRIIYEAGLVPSSSQTGRFLNSSLTKVATTNSTVLQSALLDTVMVILARRSPPPELISCLLSRLDSMPRAGLKRWIQAICHFVPLTGHGMFEVLLKVTERFCKRLQADFVGLTQCFSKPPQTSATTDQSIKPEAKGISLDEAVSELLAGLEYLLARAHETLADREATFSTKSPDQDRGLFGSMVSAEQPDSDTKQVRGSIASDYLTLNLCFKDCIHICSSVWFWSFWEGTMSPDVRTSFRHFSAKLRYRTRRILEHFVDAEPQECLELFIELWVNKIKSGDQRTSNLVLRLLQTLPGARPKIMIPVVGQALVRRTQASNPERLQQPTASSGLSLAELAAFLIEYSRSLEDDLLEEIWNGSISVLKEVLLNPMAYRQMLVQMLTFIASIGEKLENTNFGELSKMRRELGDLCLRLLTAIFTIKPEGRPVSSNASKVTASSTSKKQDREMTSLTSADLASVLCETMPILNSVLADTERLTTAYSGILQQVVGPVLRSRNYQTTLTTELIRLLLLAVKVPGVAKIWRKDVSDAFNDNRFLQTPTTFLRTGWFPVLQALLSSDKQYIPELLLRLPAPTSTGLMFGVGASSARAEADKKASLNLRRLAILTIASESDLIANHTDSIASKFEELLGASESSAPSSCIRGDVFMALRSLVLRLPSDQLTTFWPSINNELQQTLRELLPSVAPPDEADSGGKITGTASSRLQAAKLLDVLLLLRPSGFQRHEWLFVTDTVDAVYPPATWSPSALTDQIAQSMSGLELADSDGLPTMVPTSTSSQTGDLRKPWLCSYASRRYTASADVDRYLLAPFFNQLSIHAFEDIYSLGSMDMNAAEDDLIEDLFQLL